MLKKLQNWFYKDTHVVVKAGPHMEAKHDVTMSTVMTGNNLEKWTISKSTKNWPEKIGTYSAISMKNFYNPESIAYWLAFNESIGSVDVTGMIECKDVKPLVYFACNNPMIGQPHCSIWSIDGSIQYKHHLDENQSFMFSDHSGHNVLVERKGDSSYKEWVITIDP